MTANNLPPPRTYTVTRQIVIAAVNVAPFTTWDVYSAKCDQKRVAIPDFLQKCPACSVAFCGSAPFHLCKVKGHEHLHFMCSPCAADFNNPDRTDPPADAVCDKVMDLVSRHLGFENASGTDWHILTRCKSSREIGTMTIDDFEEVNDDQVAELADLFLEIHLQLVNGRLI